MCLGTLHVLTYILLQATLEIAIIIILHVRNLKHREVKNLPEITQLCHQTGISTQVFWCFLPTSHPPRYACLQFNRHPQKKTLLSLCRDALPHPDIFLHVYIRRQTYKNILKLSVLYINRMILKAWSFVVSIT